MVNQIRSLPSIDADDAAMFMAGLFSSTSAGIPGEEEADSVVEPPLDDLFQNRDWFILFPFTLRFKDLS